MIEDIARRIAFMRDLNREHVHLPLETVEKLMAAAVKGKVVDKAGKKTFQPTDKRPTHRKIADKAKADRTVKGLRKNREGKR